MVSKITSVSKTRRLSVSGPANKALASHLSILASKKLKKWKNQQLYLGLSEK